MWPWERAAYARGRADQEEADKQSLDEAIQSAQTARDAAVRAWEHARLQRDWAVEARDRYRDRMDIWLSDIEGAVSKPKRARRIIETKRAILSQDATINRLERMFPNAVEQK